MKKGSVSALQYLQYYEETESLEFTIMLCQVEKDSNAICSSTAWKNAPQIISLQCTGIYTAEMYSFPISLKLDTLHNKISKALKGNLPNKLIFFNHCIKITLNLCIKYLFEMV